MNLIEKENQNKKVNLQIKETYKVRVVRNQKETQIGEVNHHLREAYLQEVSQSL